MKTSAYCELLFQNKSLYVKIINKFSIELSTQKLKLHRNLNYLLYEIWGLVRKALMVRDSSQGKVVGGGEVSTWLKGESHPDHPIGFKKEDGFYSQRNFVIFMTIAGQYMLQQELFHGTEGCLVFFFCS